MERPADSLRLLWLPAVTATLGLLFVIFAAFLSRGVWFRTWDDAYMFVRYADELRACGAITWNRCDPPTYGLTSLAHFAAVASIRRVVGGDPAIALTIASMSAGLAFLALVARRVFRAPRDARAVVALFVAAALAWAARRLHTHFQSGMDTALAMLCAFVWTQAASEGLRRGRRLLVLGVTGALAWWVRPELAVAFAIVLLVLGEWRATIALVATLCACILAAWAYFRTPLPLPFHAKSIGTYVDFRRDDPTGAMRREAFGFFTSNVVVLGAVCVRALQERRENRRFALAVLIAIVGVSIFLVVRVHGVMANHQRFFMPLLSMALVPAIDAVERGAARVREVRRSLLVTGCLVVAIGLPLLAVARSFYEVEEIRAHPGRPHFRVREYFETYAAGSWPHLGPLLDLPDDIVIASTEVGALSVLASGKRIIDLAGLNDARFASSPFDPERLLREDRPDVIYLPHPDYVGMNRALIESARFVAEYDCQPHGKGSYGFAVRKNAPHSADLHAIFFGAH
ncbi:MAG: hypothetical protein ACXWUG_20495 [Polyangiales bacterium]